MFSHTQLLNIYLKLGYPRVGGICHGFTLRWLEACLLGEEEIFHARIERIIAFGEKLALDREAFKLKKNKQLSLQDEKLFDILGFFDSLALFHTPGPFTKVFALPSGQSHMTQVSSIASSDKMQEKKCMVSIYSEPNICTKAEIITYLDDLGLILEKSGSNTPFAIQLGNQKHTIGVLYYPGLGWKLMDINDYSLDSLPKLVPINDSDVIADDIIKYLNRTKDFYTLFNTNILTIGSNPVLNAVKKDLELFKSEHPLTKETLLRESNGVGICYIAGQEGHADIVSTVINLQLEENIKAKKENTPPADLIVQLSKPYKHKNETPAAAAANNCHLDFINELTKNNVLITVDPDSIYSAASNGFTDIIDILGKNKVALNGFADNFTPAYAAASNGFADTIKVLAKYTDLSKTTSTVISPMHIAAQKNHPQVIKTLAKHKANINQKNSLGETPIFWAAKFCSSNAIEALHECGADLNIALEDGTTPVCIAVENGQTQALQALQALLKNKADPNQEKLNGSTPAFIAAQKGNVHALLALQKHGADLNKAEKQGATPAFIAAQYGHFDICKELLRANCDFGLSFSTTATNLKEFALKENNTKVVERMNIFLNKQSNPEKVLMTPYDIAEIMGHTEITQQINLSGQKKQKAADLKAKIILLEAYGNTLITDPKTKDFGATAVNLSKKLTHAVNDWMAATKDEENVTEESFKTILDKGYRDVGTHQTEWKNSRLKKILANIAIAATGIGFFVVVGKLLVTGHTFFSETNRQQKVNDINNAFKNCMSVHF